MRSGRRSADGDDGANRRQRRREHQHGRRQDAAARHAARFDAAASCSPLSSRTKRFAQQSLRSAAVVGSRPARGHQALHLLGTEPAGVESGGGSRSRIAATSSVMTRPEGATRHHLVEHRAERRGRRASAAAPFSCSGAVRRRADRALRSTADRPAASGLASAVRDIRSRAARSPQLMERASMTLAGFRSRWTMPAAWAATMPGDVARHGQGRRRQGRAPPRCQRFASTSSITR
jgi:hypothetical protein